MPFIESGLLPDGNETRVVEVNREYLETKQNPVPPPEMMEISDSGI